MITLKPRTDKDEPGNGGVNKDNREYGGNRRGQVDISQGKDGYSL